MTRPITLTDLAADLAADLAGRGVTHLAAPMSR